ncbi:nitrogen regulation protein NR(II) [Amphritea sp. HPY]|uniref:nitrogen regulation protein NR(II) n=1 Tax=Amphritea sp. HPY TaxID=3421652 RepID=UPI003D7CC1A1
MKASDLHKHILDNLTTAAILVDGDLELVYMNPSAEMLLEASSRRLQQIAFKDWFLVDDNQQALNASLKTGHPFTKREAKLNTLKGTELTVDYSVNPLPQKYGRLLLIEVTPRDRLIRISREEELLSNHETVISLVRGLAHEIKNPLGGLRGAAQLLERELDDESLHEYTRVIIDEADRLRNLVDRLLGPHKMPQLEEVNIHAILEHVCSLVSAETGGRLQLVRDYDPSLPEFMGDREQLIQAVLNIVRNGMQAMQESEVEHPVIKLCTRVVRNITLGAEMHRLVCCVDIIDNGPGIPEDILSKIFYPMVSGRAAGTGLGLSIAQSVLAQHKGLIECETQPGTTKFQLLIPLE